MCEAITTYEIESILDLILSAKKQKYDSMRKDIDDIHDIEYLENLEKKMRTIYFERIQNEPRRNQKLILDFNQCA